MKEIGGYLELEQFNGEEFYSDLVAVNSGRNALLYILKAKKIKKLFLPYFLCESVSKMCEKEGYDYEYYSIDEAFLPKLDKKLGDKEYLYVVNYYGQLGNDILLELQAKYQNIIVDNVQAFFQKPIKGIDTVYSCRKFFGVPDGGYVSTDKAIEEAIIQDVSMNRMAHVLGRFEGNSASDYYGSFKENDKSFVNEELKLMSKLTHNLLKAIDYEIVKKKREENYKYLSDRLSKYNKLSLKMIEGPYMYPFYCKNGMKIKKKLAELKIFIPTLWPNVLGMDDTFEKDYAENILPLPVDQRYGIDDMNKIIEEILKNV